MYHPSWTALENAQFPRIYRTGELVYIQGTEADRFYYLKSGKVRIFLQSPDGAEKTLNVLEPGNIFGEASFFDGLPRVSSARTLAKSAIIPITRPILLRCFSEEPELAMGLLKYLSQTVRMLSAQLDNMAFLQADQRIARILLSLPPEKDGRGIAVTHEEIGDLAAASRVTVSRTLGDFAHRGWIATQYRRILILDRDALEGFAYR